MITKEGFWIVNKVPELRPTEFETHGKLVIVGESLGKEEFDDGRSGCRFHPEQVSETANRARR